MDVSVVNQNPPFMLNQPATAQSWIKPCQVVSFWKGGGFCGALDSRLFAVGGR
ncbi:hypothetical protein RHI63_08125 [Thermosynechococcus sp. GLH187]|uniref:hypothetical protein n=1 Tax=unclassified Thermosynechococcus TaxID=2622553 RepID=UPI00197F22C8|nr:MULTISPECIES: hypothetical protein [unclassified Thermosynechococcus]QSF48324.1 hypothetical protein JW907_08090 [Thermosynechococcus sp. TA-1]WNC44212.1 hypothetical protein RHI63_08125 [Thermosynechococcus sp. GLH187]WNC46748.1 hypothetical protein RHI71_08125 [Thermosynechococcus sp. GLH333]WNC49285.1 hypothetical protein RHI73_08125 [Thermosynechococcus sp. GLH87]